MSKTFLAAALLLCAAWMVSVMPAAAQDPAVQAVKAGGDYVVLLHGVARTSKSMGKLQAAFEKANYRVLNIDYPSRSAPIGQLAEAIHPLIENLQVEEGRKIHFVGYSMGGLVARAYIEKYRPAALGRVVLLGTPNGGSEVADFLKDNKLFHWAYGPAGQDLRTDAQLAALLGVVDYDMGVVAGTSTLDPISSYLIIKGPNDGKVSVASTKVEGMKEHVVLPVTHTFMPANKAVIAQALHFIGHGSFKK